MAFYVYILRCSDDSYYTGHTDNVESRVHKHDAGEVDSYTRSRRPVRLVFSQEFPTREEALAAERQIKGWRRAKKEAIIAGRWDLLAALSRSRPSSPALLRPSTSSGRTDTRSEDSRSW